MTDRQANETAALVRPRSSAGRGDHGVLGVTWCLLHPAGSRDGKGQDHQAPGSRNVSSCLGEGPVGSRQAIAQATSLQPLGAGQAPAGAERPLAQAAGVPYPYPKQVLPSRLGASGGGGVLPQVPRPFLVIALAMPVGPSILVTGRLDLHPNVHRICHLEDGPSPGSPPRCCVHTSPLLLPRQGHTHLISLSPLGMHTTVTVLRVHTLPLPQRVHT